MENDFIQYCKLNNIDDIEAFAKKVFTTGFNIMKYGSTPIAEPKQIEEGVTKSNVKKVSSKKQAPPPPPPLPHKREIVEGKLNNKTKKDNLYDE